MRTNVLSFFLLLLTLSVRAQVSSMGDIANVIGNAPQGTNRFSKSGSSTNALEARPSGFYTVTDNANLPANAGWPFHEMRIKQSTSANSNLTWTWTLSSHLKTGSMYENSYDGQANLWLGFKRIHSNRWFAVDEAMVPAAGDLFYFDGTNWTRLPAGSNGQFLKMVSGKPAWSN